METKTQLPAVIDHQKFGDLIRLPDILKQNQSLAQRADESCTAQISIVKAIDLTKVDATVMDGHDEKLNELSGKLNNAIKIMEERRKPFTKFFDEIKLLFTTEENRLNAITAEIKGHRQKWQLDKIRRNEESRLAQEKEAAKAEEAVSIKALMVKGFLLLYGDHLAEKLQKMNDAFNSKTADELTEYAEKLKAFEPKLDTKIFTHDLTSKLGSDVSAIFSEVCIAAIPELVKNYATAMTEERDRLVELTPSRIRELKKGDENAAAERIAQEKKEREDRLEEEKQTQASVIDMNTEIDKMEKHFDVASKATPAITQTKGSSVKKKYKATTHKAHIAIIQYWVANCMNMLTVDELDKKLSFMRTEANKALNAGNKLEAEGLLIMDDVTVRATKK